MKKNILLVLLFAVQTIIAQRYNFVNYSLEEGLSQSQVVDICQDQFGYLWVGTETGLSRFDGMNFVNYSVDDGLPSNEIEKLFIDSKNNLWVATQRGIAKFNGKTFDVYFFDEINTEYKVNDLCEFQNSIYIATDEGLIRFYNNNFSPLFLESNNLTLIRAIENSGDTLLICGSRNGLFTYKETNFIKIGSSDINELNISSLCMKGEELVISTYGNGVISLNLRTGKEWRYDMEYTRIRSVYANSNSLLCASKNGAVEIKSNGDIFYFNARNGLEFENIRSVFIDRENNLWFGTDGKGLYKLTGKSIVTYTKFDGLSSNAVMSIEQIKDGSMFFGTYDAGLVRWGGNQNNQHVVFFNQELKNNTVWTTYTDQKGHVWIGTSGGVDYLFYDSNTGGKLDNVSQLVNFKYKTRTILAVTDSTILFGGSSGIYEWMNGQLSPVFDDLALDVNKLILSDNRLYIAAVSGFYIADRLDGKWSAISQIQLPENHIKTITEDFLGNVWIGTNGNGIFIFKDGKIIPFEIDVEDSRSKTILAMITDVTGNIWISTLNGVYQITEIISNNQKFIINHFGRAEGLIALECNQNALYQDLNGYIWVGTSEGLARIDPKQNQELFSFQKPVLNITGFRLFLEQFEYSEYSVKIDTLTQVPYHITLPYNKNHLTFDFIGINLKDPGSIRYQYRLLGAEENWSPLTSNRYATYSFINHGEYDFEVRATNTIGIWSDSCRIHVVILPPFWLTWWFILLCIIVGLAVVRVVFQVRIKAIKQKQENERLGFKNRLLFLEQQSLNASMNRHFIFNSLNSIQYFINSSNKLAANKYLTSFAKLIRKNLDSSSANNFIVTLQEEIERVELYLSLEKMRFEGKFEYSFEIDEQLDKEAIEIPSMILQPFVENSIIHGVLPLDRKGQIVLKIYREYDDLVFEVIDDGIGIDNSLKIKNKKQAGDHESMGMEITNRRIELLRKLTGENLMIIGPFQMNNDLGDCLGTKVIIKVAIENVED